MFMASKSGKYFTDKNVLVLLSESPRKLPDFHKKHKAYVANFYLTNSCKLKEIENPN